MLLFRLEGFENVVAVIGLLLGWLILLALVWQKYRRAVEKPRLWRALIVFFISIIAFSIQMTIGGTTAKFAVLPLGVWVVYLVTAKTTWKQYRAIAWIGFLANYIFMASHLAAYYSHEVIYPKREVATYIANVDSAGIVSVHPSAPEAVFDRSLFQSKLSSLRPEEMNLSMDWFYESRDSGHERFPYALIGVEPRWGSGIHAEIFIQSDGKGLLVSRGDQYYYYVSEESLLEIGGRTDE